MKPIRLAILWHQHQPYYRADGKYRLPWVRLHTTKDYCEMAEHLLAHPSVRATINLVPSLIEQIEGYLGGDRDELLDITLKNTDHLTSEEKEYVRRYCLQANRSRMIDRSARYAELADKHSAYTTEDYRDLIVHHTLAWLGEFERRKDYAARLIVQDREYSEEQKQALFASLHPLFLRMLSLHRKLKEHGQIEISTSPFYHPILPLLCDQRSAAQALPNVFLPSKILSMSDYALKHITHAQEYMSERFGEIQGMWSPEGSISEESLQVLSDCGIRWTASDEGVLMQSLDTKQRGELEKYFPRRYSGIVVFFRDHHLSDKIGFDYQRWYHYDAVNDFTAAILSIRSRIIESLGEDMLDEACVTVILDGENCWEYYEANGYDFLNSLYSTLASTEEIRTVTFSETIDEIGLERIRPIDRIKAGSWINANFAIWIGHQEKNTAWDMLVDAAEFLDRIRESDRSRKSVIEEAELELMKAQGSDWFWWYGDDHHSAQRDIFDELFRMHLTRVYSILSAEIPQYLSRPIISGESASGYSTMHRGST